MEFNLTTFILEIVNFVALVWVLKALLYAPVRRVLEERSEKTRQSLEEALAAKEEAVRLKALYDSRMGDWEAEKAREKESLSAELANLRDKGLLDLKETMEREWEKGKELQEKRFIEAVEGREKEALRQSAQFAAKLLEGTLTEGTEEKLIAFALLALAEGKGSFEGVVSPAEGSVATARPLVEARRQELRSILEKRLGFAVDLSFKEDPSLLAGMELTVGSVVLRANLRDECAFFAKVGAP